MAKIIEQPDSISFYDFLNAVRKLEVPAYQRFYSWDRELINSLIDDIIFKQAKSKNLYIGTILTKDKRGTYRIVDGQQRLLTLLILLRVLCRLIKSKAVKATINDFLKGTSIHETNLQLNEAKRSQYFSNVILRDKKQPENTIDTPQEEVGDINRALTIIESHLKEKKSDLNKMYKFILDKIEFVVIQLQEKSNESEIFENINANRAELTAADLIKNYLIGSAGDGQEKKAVELWNEMFNNFNNQREVNKFIEYYCYVTSSRGGKKKNIEVRGINFGDERKMLEYFKSEAKNPFTALESLRKYSGYYKEIKKIGDAVLDLNAKSLKREIYRSVQALRYLGFESHIPLLLKVIGMVDAVEHPDIKKIINFIEPIQFLSRYALEDLPQKTKDYFYEQMRAVKSIKDLPKLIANLSKKYQGIAKKTRPKLPNLSAEVASGVKWPIVYMLARVYTHQNNSVDLLAALKSTWEHIMPQTKNKKGYPAPNPTWKTIIKKDLRSQSVQKELYGYDDKMVGYYERYVHSLGNSALLVKGDNSAIQDDEFGIKKKFYVDRENDNLLLKLVKRAEHWSSTQIKENGEYLSALYFRIFPKLKK